jgi:hypothetical protein
MPAGRITKFIGDARQRIKPLTIALHSSRIPLVRWEGIARGTGKPASIIVAGADPWIRYLPDKIFTENPRLEPIGSTWTWQLEDDLDRLSASADLVIARLDRVSARMFFSDGRWLRGPEWVALGMSMPADLEKLKRSNESVLSDVRRIQRAGLSWSVTHEDADFDAFYDQMYEPFAKNRHGEMCVVHNRAELQANFRRGGIVWTKRGDERVGGMTYAPTADEKTVLFKVLGTAGGDTGVTRDGVIAALYLFAITHAKELGFEQIDLGGTRACLADGVLRFKRKWGAGLWRREQEIGYFDQIIGARRFDQNVMGILRPVPLVVRDAGGLSGFCIADSQTSLQAADGAAAKRAHRVNWLPGLQRLIVASETGWQPGIVPPPQTALIGPTDGRLEVSKSILNQTCKTAA